jgi:hypothetical protein
MVIGMHKHLTHAHRVGATRTPEERRKVGLSMRQRVPRSAQAEWTAPAIRADPVAILIEQGRNRIQELLPVRYARMKADPFAFLRGAAAVMAIDLEKTPSAGIRLVARSSRQPMIWPTRTGDLRCQYDPIVFYADLSDDTRFFEGLLRGGTVRRRSALRPAFWNYPSSRATRCHQQNLHSRFGFSIRKSTILNWPS